MKQETTDLIRSIEVMISKWEGETYILLPIPVGGNSSVPSVLGDICTQVMSKMTDLDPEEIFAKCRKQNCVTARLIIARYLRDRKLSFPKIGEVMGGRDHSTVMHMMVRFDEYHETERGFRDLNGLFRESVGAYIGQ